MSIQTVREALLWCFVINYAIMIIWFLTIIFCGSLYDLCAKWFKVSRQRVNDFNLIGLIAYKVIVIIFNLVPLIALYLIHSNP